MERKRITVGTDNFKAIIDSNGYYVDKTLYIKQILNEYVIGRTNLTMRPRRFGKTLLLSTLRYFLDIDEKENAYLFKDLAISKETKLCEKYQNKSPVIFFTLKEVKGTTEESFIESFNQQLNGEYERHSYVKEVLSKGDLKSYNRIEDQEGTVGDFKTYLSTLMKGLYDYHHIRPIVLIDEYDVPLNTAYNVGLFDFVVNIISSMFSNGLKTNENLEFAIITGCLQIAKNQIFTGFNNPSINAVTDVSYAPYFGFTKEETKKLLTYYNLDHRYQDVLECYDGYHIGSCELINPFSLLCFVEKAVIDNTISCSFYWANSSGDALLCKMLKSISQKADLKKDFESLLSGDVIKVDVNTTVTYDTMIDNDAAIMGTLLFSGYLTRAEEPHLADGAEVGESKLTYMTSWVKIPNNEVMFCFNTIVKKFNKDVSDEKLPVIIKAFLEKDIITAEDYLNTLYRSILKVRDKDSSENNYHYFLAAILALNPCYGWQYSSQDQGTDGYADFVLLGGRNVIAIKEKVIADIEKLDIATKKAFKQIETKNYITKYEKLENFKVIKYAIIYCDHQAFITVGN